MVEYSRMSLMLKNFQVNVQIKGNVSPTYLVFQQFKSGQWFHRSMIIFKNWGLSPGDIFPSHFGSLYESRKAATCLKGFH
jgi:hypothetical protein